MAIGDLYRSVAGWVRVQKLHGVEVDLRDYHYDSACFGNESLYLTFPEFFVRFLTDRGDVYCDVAVRSRFGPPASEKRWVSWQRLSRHLNVETGMASPDLAACILERINHLRNSIVDGIKAVILADEDEGAMSDPGVHPYFDASDHYDWPLRHRLSFFLEGRAMGVVGAVVLLVSSITFVLLGDWDRHATAIVLYLVAAALSCMAAASASNVFPQGIRNGSLALAMSLSYSLPCLLMLVFSRGAYPVSVVRVSLLACAVTPCVLSLYYWVFEADYWFNFGLVPVLAAVCGTLAVCLTLL